MAKPSDGTYPRIPEGSPPSDTKIEGEKPANKRVSGKGPR